MEEYEGKLLTQFQSAIGSRKLDPKSSFMHEEYNYWIKDLQISKAKYIKLLKQFKLNCYSENAIEVGKGPDDSLFVNDSTTIVSPYFEDVHNRPGLTYVGRPVVVGEELKYFDNNEIKSLDINGGRLYLTQNVYDSSELDRWYKLAKRDTIAVGVFGRIFDSDMSAKIKALKDFARKLDDYTYNYGDLSSTYCYTIVSKKRSK